MAGYSIFRPDVVKIAVVGEPGCGKTTFIETFHSRHSVGERFRLEFAEIYPCQFIAKKEQIRAAIFEFPGNLDIPALVEALNDYHANGIFLTYSIDDPLSLEMVKEKYISALSLWKSENFSVHAVILLGTKADLFHDQQVIERLALEDKQPVTFEQGENLMAHYEFDRFFECSTDDLEYMCNAVDFALRLVFSCMNA